MLEVSSVARLAGTDDTLVRVQDNSPDCPESERPFIIFRCEPNNPYVRVYDVSPMFADFHDTDDARGLAILARNFPGLTGRPGAWNR